MGGQLARRAGRRKERRQARARTTRARVLARRRARMLRRRPHPHAPAHSPPPPRPRPQGWSPLHSAASAGHERIVTALLALGAATDATTSSGQTPLHYAVRRPSVCVCVWGGALLSAGGGRGATARAPATAGGSLSRGPELRGSPRQHARAPPAAHPKP